MKITYVPPGRYKQWQWCGGEPRKRSKQEKRVRMITRITFIIFFIIMMVLSLLTNKGFCNTVCTVTPSGVIICNQVDTNPKQVYPTPIKPQYQSPPGTFVPSPNYSQPFVVPNNGDK